MRGTTSERQGAALVELAIVLSLLVMIVMGCLDLGRFATTSIAVTNAAREGAYFAGMHPQTDGSVSAAWTEHVRASVQNALQELPRYEDAQLVVRDPIVTQSAATSRVRLEVSYPFETLLPWPLIPRKFSVNRVAEMPIVR